MPGRKRPRGPNRPPPQSATTYQLLDLVLRARARDLGEEATLEAAFDLVLEAFPYPRENARFSFGGTFLEAKTRALRAVFSCPALFPGYTILGPAAGENAGMDLYEISDRRP